jgi:hypothetical protein
LKTGIFNKSLFAVASLQLVAAGTEGQKADGLDIGD